MDDGVRISYSFRGARGNPEMEAFLSRFKTEAPRCCWIAQTREELATVSAQRIDYYNRERRHSRIGYRALRWLGF